MNLSAVSIVNKGANPVTLAEAKDRLRITHTSDDDDLAVVLAAALAAIDGPQGVGVGMMTQTWRYGMDRFPQVIELPGWPVQSITSVNYYDGDGVAQTVAGSEYYLDLNQEPARMEPVNSWPTTQNRPGAVWIEYVLGEASADDVDAALKLALLHTANHWWMNRGAVAEDMSELPMGAIALLREYRRHGIAG